MKKALSVLLCAVMLMGIVPTVYGEENITDQLEESIILEVNNPNCFVYGEQTTVGDAMPVIVEDRTLVPARFLAESLGGEADWNNDTRTAVLTYEDTTIQVPIGEDYIVVNGEKTTLDVGGTLINDRTMLPLRGICEAMGQNVAYDDGVILVGEHDFTDILNDPQYEGAIFDVREALRRGGNISPDAIYNHTYETVAFDEVLGASAVYKVEEDDVNFTSDKNVRLFSVGGIHAENLRISEYDEEHYLFTIDLYNTDYTYGAMVVYNEDKEVIDKTRIEPFEGQSANVFTAIYNVYDVGLQIGNAIATKDISYLEYKLNGVANVQKDKAVVVPKGGYVLITQNPKDSEYVGIYNASKFIVDIISLNTTWADFGATDSQKKQVEEILKESIISALTSDATLGAEIVTDFERALYGAEFNAFNQKKTVKNIMQAFYKVLIAGDIDLEGMTADAIKSVLGDTVANSALEMMTRAGFAELTVAFEFMDAFAKTTNMINFIQDYEFSQTTKSVVFEFVKLDEGYKKVDESGTLINGVLYYTKNNALYKYVKGEHVLLVQNVGYSCVTDGKGVYYFSDKFTISYKNCDGTGYRVVCTDVLPQYMKNSIKQTYGNDIFEEYKNDEFNPYILGVYGDKICFAETMGTAGWVSLSYVAIADVNTGQILKITEGENVSLYWGTNGKYIVGSEFSPDSVDCVDMTLIDMETLDVRHLNVSYARGSIGLRENGFYYFNMEYNIYGERINTLHFYDWVKKWDYIICVLGDEVGEPYRAKAVAGNSFTLYASDKGDIYTVNLQTNETKKITTIKSNNLYVAGEGDDCIYLENINYDAKIVTIYKFTVDSFEKIGTVSTRSNYYVKDDKIISW